MGVSRGGDTQKGNNMMKMVNVKNSTKTYIIMFEDFIRTLDEMGVLK